jgi:predicted nucleic acid-binding protein
MRIFLDANILFSAAKTDGAVRQLLVLLCDTGYECWVDAYVVAEARRNLAIKAPEGSIVLDSLLPRLHVAPVRAADPELYAILPLPEKDKPVMAAAIVHRCTVLVTGDRTHFGPLYGETIHGVKVVAPRGLAEDLLAKVR